MKPTAVFGDQAVLDKANPTAVACHPILRASFEITGHKGPLKPYAEMSIGDREVHWSSISILKLANWRVPHFQTLLGTGLLEGFLQPLGTLLHKGPFGLTVTLKEWHETPQKNIYYAIMTHRETERNLEKQVQTVPSTDFLQRVHSYPFTKCLHLFGLVVRGASSGFPFCWTILQHVQSFKLRFLLLFDAGKDKTC